jgi:hypothetical protein
MSHSIYGHSQQSLSYHVLWDASYARTGAWRVESGVEASDISKKVTHFEWRYFFVPAQFSFRVWLNKACKRLCCHQMSPARLQQFFFGEIVTWHHRLDSNGWGFEASDKPVWKTETSKSAPGSGVEFCELPWTDQAQNITACLNIFWERESRSIHSCQDLPASL